MIVELSDPDFFGGRGSVIVLELADKDVAIRMAEALARDTGRAVRVKNADKELVRFIQTAQKQ
jgi:hypothetical protein